MGWIAIYHDGRIVREEDNVGRPVADGQEGLLKCIAQEDFHHKVAVDLVNGVFALEYDNPINVVNGNIEITNPKLFLWIVDGETNIVGELTHWNTKFDPKLDPETGEQLVDGKGDPVVVKTDIVTPIQFRPIWFTRMTLGIPTKVIGAQATLPEAQGGKNCKKMISLFADGRVGVD